MKFKLLPIQLDQSEINKLCLQYYINKLSLFGSVLRDNFPPQSDVDMLVSLSSFKLHGEGSRGAEEQGSKVDAF